MTKLELQKGESGVFGYGSLLLKSSMETTLQHTYEGSPVYCFVHGWQRVWNSMMPNRSFFSVEGGCKIYPKNIVYLNVEPAASTSLNGVIYAISQAELDCFDDREWIYDRVDITGELKDVEVSGGRVFMYVGIEPYILSQPSAPADAAIRRSYLEIVDTGLKMLGTDAQRSYEASTLPLPETLLIEDSKDPGSNPFLADRRAQVRKDPVRVVSDKYP
jgi:cation transport regulator ChaC